ncbi:hypothetical protein ACTQWG_16030 [Blautia sp. HCP3S3_H10_1]|uniref:hypothetical protein n=1 Tax=unclassified Blautia TaxID=2648079 RepID=UPI003F923A51|nr:hypothetical protein [Clostridia bacterium]
MSIKKARPVFQQKQLVLENPYNIFYDNYMNTNATTECTGLGYRMPYDQVEWDAYRQIFDFLPVPFLDSEDIKQE